LFRIPLAARASGELAACRPVYGSARGDLAQETDLEIGLGW